MSGRFFMFSATKASERARSTLRKSRKSHVVVVLGRQRDRSTKKVCCTCKIIAFFFNKPIDYYIILLYYIYLTLSLASPLLLRLPNNITKYKPL